MSIAQRYSGKGVLITGTTGFLGKVLLQKLLFSVSCIGKIWVLIRGKEGSNLQQRFKKEVMGSACFDRLRNIHRARFDEFMQRKVQPIQGDLQKEGLGLRPEVLADLLENCHVIINCAASIDFNARLDQAMDSNIRGSLRMLELARILPHLQVFTHISTCYVNCDQRGLIKEEIIDRATPAEEELQILEEMPIPQLVAETRRILGSYPNTYTFTKSLCERLMKARQGNVPLCIVRPAIINTSIAEPFPGWIDSIAAAAAMFMFVGLGIVHETKGNVKKIADTVPVDIVVANIIVASAYNFNNRSLPIYHVGSSDRNPLTWGAIRDEVCSFWNAHTSPSQLSRAELLVTENQQLIDLRRWMRSLPLEVYRRMGPLLGKQAQRNAQRMQKTMNRGKQIGKMFSFFASNEWIYECRNFQKFFDFLTPAQRSEYLIDMADIDAREFIRINNYGIQKYILKENIDLKASNLFTLHQKPSYFSDIKWAFQNQLDSTPRKAVQMQTRVLSSPSVLKAVEAEAARRVKEGMEEGQARSAAESEARRAVEELVCEVRPGVVKAMAWTVHKVFKNMFEQINVNKEMLQELREIEQAGNAPIVLLPTHRSYFDFLVISYIFFFYKLRLPHFIADESLLQARVLPLLVRSSGAFFFRPLLYAKSGLYRVVFDKYLELLLRQGSTLQFFIEGHRSRTGKIRAPQPELLNAVLDTVLFDKASDACLVPITVNYQKVLEGDTFPAQLLGEERVAESLTRVLKASLIMRNNYGRVFVQICKPIMTRPFIDRFCSSLSLSEKAPLFRERLGEAVGLQVVQRLTEGIVIMSTAIVSSVLLMHRKGVSEDELVRVVNEIVRQLLRRGCKVGGVSENSGAVAVNNAVGFLSGVTRSKRSIFELTISAGDGLQKLLMLSYYRNTLIHAFLPDAFLACALASFGEQLSAREGVLLPRLHTQTALLARLLRNECYLQHPLQSSQEFMRLVGRMADEQLVQLEGERIIVHPSGMRLLSFYCSLLKAQIQCCWASLVYAISIARGEQRRQQASSLGKFFDKVQWFMESLHGEKVIDCLEACSLESIKSMFALFEQDSLLRLTPGGKKRSAQVEVLVPTEQLQGLQNSIKLFRNSPYSSVLSPEQAARPNAFPAKL